MQAFLAAIKPGEGTAGPMGYNTLFGGGLFYSFADHPRQKITRNGLTSTAAGAYQILAGTWDDFCRAMGGAMPFTPENQDACAVWLIRRRGALEDVRNGNFAPAVRKCAKEWASLPGSPYGQPMVSMDQVQAAYEAAGGEVA